MATKRSEERRVLTVIWSIDNINLIETKRGMEGIPSPLFGPRLLEGNWFFLDLFPRGESGDDTSISLGLHVCDGLAGLPIDCEWEFVDAGGSGLGGGAVWDCVLEPDVLLQLPGCPTHEEVFATRRSEFIPSDTLTVRCRIWKSVGDLPYDELICGRTRLDTSEYAFPWIVSDFSCLGLSEEVLTGVTLGDFGVSDHFVARMSLDGESLEDASLSVELAPNSISVLLVTLKLSLLDAERKAVKSVERDPEYIAPYSGRTLLVRDLASRKELIEGKSDVLVDDALTLYCEISAVKLTNIIERNHCGFANTKLDVSKLAVI